MTDAPLVLWLSDIGRKDGDKVGGKNASLGEMIRSLREAGIRVPGGFATTATAYWLFIDANGLREKIADQLGRLKDDRLRHRLGAAARARFHAHFTSDHMVETYQRVYCELAD